MLNLLIRLFVKNREDTTDPVVRNAYARLTSIYGICINIVLFVAKYLAGAVSGSMSIVADAFNNLSDAASSVITLLGFLLAGKKPDKDHPFGHGRIEYIAGFIVSAMILMVGGELAVSSLRQIFNPEPLEVGVLPVAIMLIAILVKFYMFMYNRTIGKMINSTTHLATATDSLSDCIATSVTLISMGVAYFLGINIDGWAGLVVSFFILYAGFNSTKETISPLLGQPPTPELVRDIEAVVVAHPEVLGIHDMIVHDYGPGRLYVSLHAEVSGNSDIFLAHDAIDVAERELGEKFGCLATIHLDPIETDNPLVNELREKTKELVAALFEDGQIHDFRIVPGPTHTNLIFDTLLPMDCKISNEAAQKLITDQIHEQWPEYYGVVTIDRSYV